MTVSASVLGFVGIVLSFLPQEIAAYFGLPESSSILLQLCGALYFGFAVLNWMAKGNLVGGIYSKPVAVANFAHFLVGGLALLKYNFRQSETSYTWIPAAIYLLFALLFGYVFFVNPVAARKGS